MPARKKAYLTPAARAYVLAAKRRLKAILKERGMTHASLSAQTGIPASTISHWLNTSRPDFLGVGDAAMICAVLGVSLQEILPDASWQQQPAERSAILSFFLDIPLGHAQWLIELYQGALKLPGNK